VPRVNDALESAGEEAPRAQLERLRCFSPAGTPNQLLIDPSLVR
jgi:hypothetical protein